MELYKIKPKNILVFKTNTRSVIENHQKDHLKTGNFIESSFHIHLYVYICWTISHDRYWFWKYDLNNSWFKTLEIANDVWGDHPTNWGDLSINSSIMNKSMIMLRGGPKYNFSNYIILYINFWYPNLFLNDFLNLINNM